MTTPIVVPLTDVLAIQEKFQAGETVPSAKIFEVYCDLMARDGREPASRQGLGRALTRANWERKVVRVRRGPRGAQKLKETPVRILPSSRTLPISIEDRRMAQTLRDLLDGGQHNYLTREDIWTRYVGLGREQGWSWSMGKSQVSQWLNENGFPLARLKGGPGRYVDRGRIDSIVPPQV